MKTEILPFESGHALQAAISTINNGGVIAFPTDTVYGVACDLWNPEAIDKVFAAKKRTKNKPLPILVGVQEQLSQITDISQINQNILALLKRFWPGAMTVIMPKQASIPQNLSPFDTIGVRMPNHSRLLELLKKTGPLAVTSANISGDENPTSAFEVNQQLGGRIDLILDGGKTDSAIPSTVIASTKDGFNILRQGAITEEEIMATFK